MVKAPQVSYGHRIVVEVNKKDNIIIRKTTMVQQKMKRNYCTEFPFFFPFPFRSIVTNTDLTATLFLWDY